MKKHIKNITYTVVVLIVILYFGYLYINILDYLLPTLEQKALFGDSFGFANSILTGLSLLGLVFTILLQREELKLQREELKRNTEELKRSADSQEKMEEI